MDKNVEIYVNNIRKDLGLPPRNFDGLLNGNHSKNQKRTIKMKRKMKVKAKKCITCHKCKKKTNTNLRTILQNSNKVEEVCFCSLKCFERSNSDLIN